MTSLTNDTTASSTLRPTPRARGLYLSVRSVRVQGLDLWRGQLYWASGDARDTVTPMGPHVDRWTEVGVRRFFEQVGRRVGGLGQWLESCVG